MGHAKRLIVGLGNPGAQYADTRHNVGFRVVHALAEELEVELTKSSYPALTAWTTHRERELGVALPLTYMNRSGSAVQPLMQAHDLAPSDVLVVVDDLNLAVGRLRLRPGGSAGGHNGLADIGERLGTTDFPRLRLGIGNDYAPGGQSDYVLSPFAPDEEPLIATAVRDAVAAALTAVHDGLEAAMNRFN